MHALRRVAIGLLLAGTLSSCALMNEREWDGCAIGGGILGATAGGITGGVVSNNAIDDPSNSTRGGAIAGGIVGGGALGAVIGHLVCDPEKVTPAPPPPPPPPPAAPRKIGELHGADFDFNKSVLKPEGQKKIDAAIAELKAHPEEKVSVEGHTDSIGGDAYNVKLSQRRADTVKDYMVKNGIAESRLSTKAWGKSKPIADNKTEAGRAENRRVELIVVP